ncbi:MAG: multiheme c-type cytochrome [Pseudomonadota bacterium]
MRWICLILLLVCAPSIAIGQTSSATYVGSNACRACHAEAADAWVSSHHAKAWTAPTGENIVADFNDTEFRHDGTLTRFRTEDGRYFVTVTEKDGVTTDYPVHSVAGIEPLQQYLLETEPGRLQSFDVVWDTKAQRWYHLYPDQDLPPSDALHWTGPYKNWNARCAECHATGYEKNYNRQARTYRSLAQEIGVGCEACHGPGSAHLDWATGKAPDPSVTGLTDIGLTMDFNAGAEATIQQCATCHSRREAFLNGNPEPGTAFADAYNLALLRPGLYHPDGQILEEVYVYGSFLQSKMYAQGVSCSNCHEPHSARLLAEGNGICTQCHSPAGNPAFPTLALKNYDNPRHHFHVADSAGAQCKNCHMIERVYMGVDGRRDHSFRIPRPDLSLDTVSPNACTDCHDDRSSAWAAAAVEEWYPDSTHRGPHFGQVLAAAQRDVVAARNALVTLAEDRTEPGIVRATATWLLEQSINPALAESLAPLLDDPDPAVRTAAVGLHLPLPPDAKADLLTDALDDPTRAVRIETTKTLLNVPPYLLEPTARQKLQAAAREWQNSAANNADFPEIHLVLGGSALMMRNLPFATGAFREALRLDPQREEAWVMLVRLAEATDGPRAAQLVLGEALSHLPGSDQLNAMRSDSLLPPPPPPGGSE